MYASDASAENCKDRGTAPNVKRLMISILDTNFPLQKVKIRKLFEKYAFPGTAFEAG